MKNSKKLIVGLSLLLMGLISSGSIWADDEKPVFEDAVAAASFFKKYDVQQIVLLHLKDATNKYDKLNVDDTDLANTILVRELYLFYYGGYETIYLGVNADAHKKAKIEETDVQAQFKALSSYAGMINDGKMLDETQLSESLVHLSKLDLALHKYIQQLGL